MIASLPMYWREENAAAWRSFWADVQAAGRAHGLNLPDLTAPGDIPAPWTAHWLRPDLALSQTCSLPLRTALRDRVTYVGTFDFGLDGPAGHYHSVLVRKADGPPVRTLALNGHDSQSGFAAGLDPLNGAPPETAYALHAQEHHVTGAHQASLEAVAEGSADAAYLDAVTHRLCGLYDPTAAEVAVIGRTRSTPGLPLITARGTDPAPLRAVLRAVFDARPAWIGAPELGGLRDFVVLDVASYHALAIPDTTRARATPDGNTAEEIT